VNSAGKTVANGRLLNHNHSAPAAAMMPAE